MLPDVTELGLLRRQFLVFALQPLGAFLELLDLLVLLLEFLLHALELGLEVDLHLLRLLLRFGQLDDVGGVGGVILALHLLREETGDEWGKREGLIKCGCGRRLMMMSLYVFLYYLYIFLYSLLGMLVELVYVFVCLLGRNFYKILYVGSVYVCYSANKV